MRREPRSERYVFAAFWVVEICWQLTYAWRTLWNGVFIPAYDVVRARIFWRLVEKARLTLKR